MATPTPQLSPYDTGERCEPRVWITQRALNEVGVEYFADQLDSFGKVDFDNDEGSTIVTVHVERLPDGRHRLVVDPHCGIDELEITVLHDSDGSAPDPQPAIITRTGATA